MLKVKRVYEARQDNEGMVVGGDVTFVYAARDSEHNNAIVLKELVASLMKDLAQA